MALARWLIATVLVALPTQALAQHALLPANCHTEVAFVGFSRNERTLAILTQARCSRPDRSVDQLQVVEVLAAVDGHVLATFQQAPAWNVAGGQRSLLGHAELAAYYAPLAHAQSPAAWERLRRQGQFGFRQHDFADASVRLRVQGADAQAVRLKVAKGGLEVLAPPGQDVHFVVTGRLADGTHVDLATFAPAAAAAAHPSTLNVFHSPAGHRVALLWHSAGSVRLATYNTPGDSRFANNTVGAVNVLNGTADEVETLFKALHPATAKAWDENVGDLF